MKEINTNIHESGEDYLEKILMLQEMHTIVRSVDLAEEFNFSRAAISKAVKILKSNGYIEVGEKGELILTEAGKAKAEETLKKHRTITDFFILLGIDKTIAEKDACRIEHIIHPETFKKIKELYNKLNDDKK